MSFDQNSFLGSQKLRTAVVTAMNGFRDEALSSAELQQLVIPPEARRIGVPLTTDIPGFDRDARQIIQEALLSAYPNGATAGAAARFAHDIAERYRFQGNSAGPYLHHAAQRLAETLCPGIYGPNQAPAQQEGVAFTAFFNEVRLLGIRNDAWNDSYLSPEDWAHDYPVLNDENIGPLLGKLERVAETRSGLDDDAMAYEWPEVRSTLQRTFGKLRQTNAGRPENRAAQDGTEHAPTPA